MEILIGFLFQAMVFIILLLAAIAKQKGKLSNKGYWFFFIVAVIGSLSGYTMIK